MKDILWTILGIVLVLVGFSIPILLAFLAPYLGGWYVILWLILMYLWFDKVVGYRPSSKGSYVPEEDAGGTQSGR